jgi:hypothetical protein
VDVCQISGIANFCCIAIAPAHLSHINRTDDFLMEMVQWFFLTIQMIVLPFDCFSTSRGLIVLAIILSVCFTVVNTICFTVFAP